jgi:hypothetical protein
MAAEFQDLTGKTWRVALTVGKARAVKARLGVNLLAVGDQAANPLVRLADDPQALCEVLWALVNPDWPAPCGDQEAFWNAVDDSVLERATAALTEALLGFFRPGRRAVVRAALELQAKTEANLARQISAMDASDPAVNAVAERLLGTIRKDLGAALPGT